MADAIVIPSKETDVEADHNSWTSIPLGYLLLIEESPEYYLLIESDGDSLLIE